MKTLAICSLLLAFVPRAVQPAASSPAAVSPVAVSPVAGAASELPHSPGPGGREDPMRIFDARVGSWDLAYTIRTEGGEAQGGGVETYRFAADGKWMLVDFEGQLFGEPYSSHGVTGFDPESGAYVSYFFDPFLTRATISEGTWDAEARTMLKWSDGKDFSGRDCRWKQVLDYSEADSFTLEMYAVYSDGKEEHAIRCTAERRVDGD